MSHLRVVPRAAPNRQAGPIRLRGRSVDWRLVALAAFVLVVVAAEIGIVIAAAPTVDPLAVVSVP